jgi:hypothetical protein
MAVPAAARELRRQTFQCFLFLAVLGAVVAIKSEINDSISHAASLWLAAIDTAHGNITPSVVQAANELIAAS